MSRAEDLSTFAKSLTISNNQVTLDNTNLGSSVVLGTTSSPISNNLVFANGNGIDFSAAAGSNAGSTSALLDDYEEGTFAPTIKGENTAGTGNYTNGFQRGNYVKIGNHVWCSGNVYVRSHTGSGNILVSGLPFTMKGSGSGRTDVFTGTVGRIAGLSYNEDYQIMGIMFLAGTTDGRLVLARSGVAYAQIGMDTDFQLAFNVFYEVA